jgi:hypothetical protein
MSWTKVEEQLFYDYVHKAEKMDPLRAMILLTKACMNYVGVSAGYRSMAYYAGGHWLKAFNKTDHPLTAQTINMTFREVMPLICSDYSQEEYGEFNIIHIDPDDEERLLSKMMNELDDETVIALCMGYWLGNM